MINGFYNNGSLCWMNSLLQALLSCEIFYSTVKKETNLDTNTLKELHNMIKSNSRESYSSTILEALGKDLKESQPKNYEIICSGAQQSASEGFILLLDCIKSLEIKKLFYSKFDNGMLQPYHTLFDIKRLSEVGLIDYLKYDIIDTEDKKLVRKLTHAPYILVFIFNKYNQKIIIEMPKTFNLTPSIKYILKSDILHSGSLGGGHYVARGYRNDKCYMFNDTSVHEIEDMTPSANTYMMFYELTL